MRMDLICRESVESDLPMGGGLLRQMGVLREVALLHEGWVEKDRRVESDGGDGWGASGPE